MHPVLLFLKTADLSRQQLVDRLRAGGSKTMSVAYLNQIVIGHRYPSRELALLIEKVTDGAVTLEAVMKWQKPLRDDAPAGPEATPAGGTEAA